MIGRPRRDEDARSFTDQRPCSCGGDAGGAGDEDDPTFETSHFNELISARRSSDVARTSGTGQAHGHRSSFEKRSRVRCIDAAAGQDLDVGQRPVQLANELRPNGRRREKLHERRPGVPRGVHLGRCHARRG